MSSSSLGSRADPSRLTAAIRDAFPDLEPVEPLCRLGSGFRSEVFETASGAVVRIGRNVEAVEGYAREVRLLPALQDRVPVQIPRPRWYAEPCLAFPFGAIAYPKLAGQSVDPGQISAKTSELLARDVGRFLAALHRVPLESLPGLDPPDPAARRAALVQQRDDVLAALRQELIRGEYERVARWWEAFLQDEAMDRFTPVLRHGDLWYEHLLVDEAGDRLVGVLDFETAAIGDPAQDFAVQLYLGERFMRQVLAAYREAVGLVDEGIDDRIEKLWELREFSGVQFAVRFNDVAELKDSIGKLRAGPILR